MTFKEELDPILQKVRGWYHQEDDSVHSIPIDQAISQILDLVEKEIIGEDETEPENIVTDNNAHHYHRGMALGANGLRYDQRKELRREK